MLVTTQPSMSVTRSTRSRIWAVSLIRCSMFWASHDELRSFRWDPGTRTFGAVATNSMLAGYPGGMLAVSSQAGAAGTSILWAVDTNGVVHAYDAFNVANEIWNSSQIANDALGKFSKFGQPVVADG